MKNVGEVLAALALTLLTAEMALPNCLGDGVLNGADAYAGLGSDPTDCEIAKTVMLDLPHLRRHAA
jgi:hypothetical protein